MRIFLPFDETVPADNEGELLTSLVPYRDAFCEATRRIGASIEPAELTATLLRTSTSFATTAGANPFGWRDVVVGDFALS